MHILPTVIVVIPVSTAPLTWFEEVSLEQVHKVLKNYDICYIAPDDTDISWLSRYSYDKVELFDGLYFGSAYAHNRLLLSKEFYQRFINYDYILLYHLDAFVFFDNLSYFVELGYDYIAAPHPERSITIGGKEIKDGLFGGFCLRKVDKFLKTLVDHSKCLEMWFGQEDCFFSWCAQKFSLIKKAPLDIAISFAHETNVRKMFRKNNNKLPMGVHAWWKRDYAFYRPYFEKLGYHIPPNLEYMVNDSLDFKYRRGKTEEYLFKRLFRVEEKRNYVKKYLIKNYGDTRKFAIWGAGLDGHKFYACMQYVCNIVMCFDKDSDKWGKKMGDLVISKPDFSYIKNKAIFVFVATKTHGEKIAEELKSAQFEQGRNFIIVGDFQSEIISYLKDVVKK